jgi:hypothetical protein
VSIQVIICPAVTLSIPKPVSQVRRHCFDVSKSHFRDRTRIQGIPGSPINTSQVQKFSTHPNSLNARAPRLQEHHFPTETQIE